MSVILGTATQVIIDGKTDGFQSVNWNVNRQPNRLWQLGDWSPYRTQVAKTISVNITTYASVLNSLALAPSTSCANSNATKSIDIVAAACASPISISYSAMYINSYSYSKGDAIGFGTESWSFQLWVLSDVTGPEFIGTPAPTYVLQGVAEGTYSGDPGLNVGMVLNSVGIVTGEQGSVAAGFPGLGNADTQYLGLVTHIGGGTLESNGKIGQSSATIPHQPVYVG